jgi:hypothetical protein
MTRDIKAFSHIIPINISKICNKNSDYLLLNTLNFLIDNTLWESITYCQKNNITPSNLKIFLLFVTVDDVKQIDDLAYKQVKDIEDYHQKKNRDYFYFPLFKRFKEVNTKIFLDIEPAHKFFLLNSIHEDNMIEFFPNYQVFENVLEYNHLMFRWKEITEPHNIINSFFHRVPSGILTISDYIYFINSVIQLTLNYCQENNITPINVTITIFFHHDSDFENEEQKFKNFNKNTDPNNFPHMEKFKRVELVCVDGYGEEITDILPAELKYFPNYLITRFPNGNYRNILFFKWVRFP